MFKALSADKLPSAVLRSDRTGCTHYEDCGLGDKALYVGIACFARAGYIPLTAIDRVYKRLCVTKGFFESGRVYATLCYLVVCHDGIQKAYRFTHEENLDALLDAFRENTDIPVGKA